MDVKPKKPGFVSNSKFLSDAGRFMWALALAETQPRVVKSQELQFIIHTHIII